MFRLVLRAARLIVGVEAKEQAAVSMELLVIFALGKAPTMDAWQRELDARHTPLQFTEKVDISEHSGFLAATIDGHKSGLFFLIENYAELASNYPVIDQLGLQQPVVYSLGYGGDLYECAAAFYSASALVSAFGGKAFEPQGGVFMGEQELLAAAKECHELARTQ